MGTLTAEAPKAASEGARTLVSYDPMTREKVGEVAVHDAAWVDRAVGVAREAQRAWAERSPRERARVLERAAQVMLDESDRLADLVARECGKTHAGALLSDVGPSADALHYIAKVAPKVLSRRAPVDLDYWRLMGRRSYLVARPIGVVGVISPWNFPLFLSMGSTLMALAAGNAVILKPSEVTPLSGGLVGEIFQKAGLPEGLLHVGQGDGRTGQAVVERVDKIFFIGSERTGARILAAAAPRLTPCVMELGGNAPALVLRDADLEMTAQGICWGAFFNAGQICASVQRVYVDRQVFDRFTDQLVSRTEALRVLPDRRGTDVGALTCEMQMRVVEGIVEDAKKEGAKVLTGGRRLTEHAGLFYAPTVLTDVRQGTRFAREEVFGPACMVMPFDDEAEAVRLANDTEYGLTASVWTKDLGRGARLGERIEAGTVTVNDHAVTAGMIQTPWGGHKRSGFGVVGSAEGLYEFAYRRHVHVNRLASRLTPPWWFPEAARLGEGMKQFARAVAGEGVVTRLKALKGAVKDLFG